MLLTRKAPSHIMIRLNRIVAWLLVLVFLTSSYLFNTKPVSAATAVENSWALKAPMHVARSDLGIAVVNGKIYAIGGNTESGRTPTSGGHDYKMLGWINDTNEEYDPTTDTWTLKTPMPTPRCNFAIAAFENKIYCMGGIIDWNSGRISVTGVNEVYDPATDTWETKAPMPNLASATAIVVNGRIYVIGGGGANETLNQVYDPATDTWTIKKAMPAESMLGGVPNTMSNLLSAEVDGKIFVMSYYDLVSSGTWIYNPVNDSWVLTSSSPFPLLSDSPSSWWSHAAGATTGVNALKRIYVFFEKIDYSQSIPILVFNPSSESWARIGTLPTRRRCFGIAVVNDILYAIGGRRYDYPYPYDGYFIVTEETMNEQYTPIGYGTPDPFYDGTAPTVTLLSPENKTYYELELPLSFMVDEPSSWIRYKLDGNTVEIDGNTTLSGLTYGSHNLTLYITDIAGNTRTSETIDFTIAEELGPNPVVPVVAASAATVAVVGVGLLVYFKKRKH
jgi:N-acetylneuraminic acid mutarotase